MCGVAGFSGTIGNKYVRMALAEALGHGIDKRGGHASGWVCMTDGSVQTAKRLGSFQDAGMAWLLPLATSSAMMMHARWATHGSKEEVRNAHPFTVKRGEKTVLHGIHNGVLQNTEESARKHGRDHTVDSLEFFQLLADGNRDAIADIGGYGVVLWMKPRSNNIYICKLTAGADLVMARTAMGGLVWASTDKILTNACKAVGVSLTYDIPIAAVGKTYIISGDNCRLSNNRPLKLKPGQTRLWSDYGSYQYSPHTSTTLYPTSGRSTQGMKSPNEETVPDWQARRAAYAETGDGWVYDPNARYEKDGKGMWYKVNKVTGQRTPLGSTLVTGQRTLLGSTLLTEENEKKAEKAEKKAEKSVSRGMANALDAAEQLSDDDFASLLDNPATVCQHGLKLDTFCNVCDVYAADSERGAIRDDSPETQPSSAGLGDKVAYAKGKVGA